MKYEIWYYCPITLQWEPWLYTNRNHRSRKKGIKVMGRRVYNSRSDAVRAISSLLEHHHDILEVAIVEVKEKSYEC